MTTKSGSHETASYRVARLYRADGSVGSHFLDELASYGTDWETSMKDSHFTEIIGKELRAEASADGPLGHLVRLAPNEAAGDLFAEWLTFVNADLEPWVTGGAIHFRPHWARVLMLALTLGVREGLPDDDLRCLSMAAVFHDSRRNNPYLDTGHGERAAEYYAQFCRETAQGAPRVTAVGRGIRFDPRTYLAILWHDRDDNLGIEEIRAVFDANAIPRLGITDVASLLPEGASADPVQIYRLFKDADGLDRVRLGAGEPDPAYLRTGYAKGLLDLAHELLDAVDRAAEQGD